MLDQSIKLTNNLLASNPTKLAHSMGVYRKMLDVVDRLAVFQPQIYLSAAVLHDIGYSTIISRFDFHQIMGYEHLTNIGYPREITLSVLHHSFAKIECEIRAPILLHVYERNPITDPYIQDIIDLVSYCDWHISPQGKEVTFEERMDEVLERYKQFNGIKECILQIMPQAKELIDKINRRMVP